MQLKTCRLVVIAHLAPLCSGDVGVRADNHISGDLKPDAYRARYSTRSRYLLPYVHRLREVS